MPHPVGDRHGGRRDHRATSARAAGADARHRVRCAIASQCDGAGVAVLERTVSRPPSARTVVSTIGREDGSTLLLTIFYGFLSLALVLVVVAITSLYLERKRLFSVADSAALVGAEAFAIRDVSITDDGPRVVLVT